MRTAGYWLRSVRALPDKWYFFGILFDLMNVSAMFMFRRLFIASQARRTAVLVHLNPPFLEERIRVLRVLVETSSPGGVKQGQNPNGVKTE